MRYARIVQEIVRQPWEILPWTAEVMCSVVNRHIRGEVWTREQIDEAIGEARPRKLPPAGGAVAVLPVTGIITQRAEMVDDVSGPGMTSTDKLGRQIDAALNDPEVGAIVLDVDSPGGSVYGTTALAQQIFDSRGRKPIYAVANSLAASAAYKIASSAEQVIVAPMGEVGSIGTLSIHEDHSEQLAAEGVRVTLISAGKYKTEGNPYGPLDAEAITEEQRRVDEYYAAFVDAVARGRGRRASEVRSEFGQGRLVGADEAVRRGMADRVATLDQVVGELARTTRRPGQSRQMRRNQVSRASI